jgi:prophage regulatory protein
VLVVKERLGSGRKIIACDCDGNKNDFLFNRFLLLSPPFLDMAESIKKAFTMSQSQKIIRLKQAIAKTGLSRSTIYVLLSHGEFPAQIKLSPRAMGFLESEVDAWIASRAAARNGE